MRTSSGMRRWTKAAKGPSVGSPSSSAPTTMMWPSSGETSLYVGCPLKTDTNTDTVHRYMQIYCGGCVFLHKQRCAVWYHHTPQMQTTHTYIRWCNLYAHTLIYTHPGLTSRHEFPHSTQLETRRKWTSKWMIWFVMTVIQWASELCLTLRRTQWKHHP